MHELSIAESVVETVLDRTGNRPVSTVWLQVGQLSGVVPDALFFCFDLATEGTALQGAVLQIDTPPGRAHCRDCQSDFVLPDLILLCDCGSAAVDVVAGRELYVLSVELV